MRVDSRGGRSRVVEFLNLNLTGVYCLTECLLNWKFLMVTAGNF